MPMPLTIYKRHHDESTQEPAAYVRCDGETVALDEVLSQPGTTFNLANLVAHETPAISGAVREFFVTFDDVAFFLLWIEPIGEVDIGSR